MLKKLIYRSHYRGTKEGDYLLSAFAKDMLSACTTEELEMYKQLIEHNDTKIHQWILYPEDRPSHLKEIVEKITDFHNLKE